MAKIKLSVLGLFKFEGEELKVKEIMIILALVMVFITIMVILLRHYTIPVIGVTTLLNKAGIALENYILRS